MVWFGLVWCVCVCVCASDMNIEAGAKVVNEMRDVVLEAVELEKELLPVCGHLLLLLLLLLLGVLSCGRLRLRGRVRHELVGGLESEIDEVAVASLVHVAPLRVVALDELDQTGRVDLDHVVDAYVLVEERVEQEGALLRVGVDA